MSEQDQKPPARQTSGLPAGDHPAGTDYFYYSRPWWHDQHGVSHEEILRRRSEQQQKEATK